MGGGSRVISASSFWILLAEVLNCFALKDLDNRSLAFRSLAADEDEPEAWAAAAEAPPEPEPADELALTEAISGTGFG